MIGQRLDRDFFARPSPVVAQELLGCWLCRRLPERTIRVQLIETEAYLGAEDPASHAYRGPTPRNAPMFGPAGIAYVYFIYGMHHCLNVVTGPDGDPQAVLLRAAQDQARLRLGGPGLLCRGLAIDLQCNGLDLCAGIRSGLWFEAGSEAAPALVSSRVGVRDLRPLRFRRGPAGESA